jgi:hypothetical protein
VRERSEPYMVPATRDQQGISHIGGRVMLFSRNKLGAVARGSGMPNQLMGVEEWGLPRMPFI